MKITFFGAAQEVTGSRYLIQEGNTKILVDCGLFQGDRQSRKRNWDPFPIDPSQIDAVVLTHAHIDHTGYIPVLVKKGFRGKIYCSAATYALCAIMLLDSASLQEEDAKKINDYGYSSHKPALPLYTKVDAQNSLKYFQVLEYNTVLNIGGTFDVTLIPCGHILGASFVIVSNGKDKLTFSGDLGNPKQLIMKAPSHLTQTDFLVVESTYGDRLHKQTDPMKSLQEIVNRTVQKGGVLIIPSFAVGRAQTILYCLYQLKKEKLIPNIPVYLDSPMAISVTDLFCNFNDEHTLPSNSCENIFDVAKYIRTAQESKQLDRLTQPAVIIAGSGMANGGRALEHFKHYISDAKNTIVFLGFQAKGTEGRSLVEGAKEIKIFDRVYEVNAEIKTIDTLSAHADYAETLEWLSYFENSPKKVFITHGELKAAQSLKAKIEERFGWPVVIPKYLESFDLD